MRNELCYIFIHNILLKIAALNRPFYRVSFFFCHFQLRNQVKREIEKSKVNYYADRVRNLQTIEPRKWHQEIRTMTRNVKSDLRIPVPGIEDSEHGDIANYINDAFVNVSSGISPLDIATLESFLPACSPAPELYPWEVYAQLKKVKASKASGPDGISPKIIKEFAYEFSTSICDILNSSYAEGVVPTQWKKAIVVPIPKTNPPKCDKLRPVSLSDCFAKVAETFITDWILEDISDKIDLQQYGNVKGVITSHYLVSLLHFLHQGSDKVNNVGTVVLTDFSKAFDMVDHNLLIEKFIHIGVRRSIVPWLCDFLSNRMQCVRYNSTLSDFATLSAGLPQGTKLGPIGFQVIINYAVQNNSDPVSCWKYVDDLTIAENRTYPDSSRLQVILDSFSQWTENNSLSLNPAKCQALQICFKTDVPHPTELKINGCSLNFVDHAKILGVWLQHDLSWDKNISEMISKTNRRLYMLRMLKRFGFKKDELITVYKGYIRPLLEYADVVWNSSLTLKQTKTIEQVQRRACRIESLATRREDHCLKFAEGLADIERTKDLLPPTRLESHSRNLRNAHKISQLRFRTSRFKNSPIPHFIELLNK